MCGDSSKPFAPSRRSVSVASRHGLMWLAFRCLGSLHPGDTTRIFSQENVRSEHALPTPRSHELLSERRSGDAGIRDCGVR